MPCPKCKSNNIRSSGKYYVKRRTISGKKIQRERFKCLKCGSSFVRRDKIYHKKIGLRTRLKIIQLYKTNKVYPNKYDRFKKKTYSTREIAKMLNVSKSYVYLVVKEALWQN